MTESIKSAIPHRYPFLLIDRIIDIAPGESITALKNVTYNEPFFEGHFPDNPIMPGVLIVEAMAQACGVLIFRSLSNSSKNGLFYLAGVDKARFRKAVIPGDQIFLEVKLLKHIKEIYKFEATAHVQDNLVCSAVVTTTGKIDGN